MRFPFAFLGHDEGCRDFVTVYPMLARVQGRLRMTVPPTAKTRFISRASYIYHFHPKGVIRCRAGRASPGNLETPINEHDLSLLRGVMEGRSLSEIRDELERLMREQIESLRAQTFGGLTEEERREQDRRLNRIREVSADFLSALKNDLP